jgi:hypothetical protein
MTSGRNSFGAYTIILTGLSYFLIGVTFLLLPADQQVGNTQAFLHGLTLDRTMIRLNYFCWALAGITGLGAVPVITNLVREGHEDLADWVRNLAILGFTVLAIDHFHVLGFDRFMVAAYQQGDAAAHNGLAGVVPYLPLDRGSWLTGGAVGLWLLVVNILALSDGRLPRVLGALGIIAGLLSMTAVAAQYLKPILGESILMPIIAVGAVVVGPLWFVWTGLIVRARRSPPIRSTAAATLA